MKKTTIIKVITIGTACFLAILAGYTLAKSEHFIQQIAKEITEGASIKGSNKINSNEIKLISVKSSSLELTDDSNREIKE